MPGTLVSFPLVLLAVMQAAPQNPPRATDKCTIEGLVVKAATGEPLKKARVGLQKVQVRTQPIVVATGETGRFELKDVEPGRYRLWVECNGYVRQEYGQRRAGRSGSHLTLEPGQRLRDVTFRLVVAAVISGRVFDEDGEPLARVRVQALQPAYWQGRRQLDPTGADTTNDLGEYRLWGLAPGRYVLSATYGADMFERGPMRIGEEALAEEAYAPTYYSGTTEASRATPIELSAGEEASGMDFHLMAIRTVRVRGRVFNTITDEVGRGIFVSLAPRDSPGWGVSIRGHAVEDAKGNFEIRGVAPSRYIASAMWMGEGQRYFAQQPIEVGNVDLEGVNLVIARGVDLTGQARIEGKTDTPLTDLHIFLRPRDDATVSFPSSTRPKSDGTFAIRNVPEGNFRVLVVGGSEASFLKGARLGPENVLEAGLTVIRGKQLPSLDLVVSTAGGQIEGQVLTEEKLPASGATVVLVPHPDRRSRTELYKTAATDQYGRFALRGVAPGEYQVYAWEEMEPGMYLDAEFLRQYEGRGETVQVSEAGRYTVELKLIAAASESLR